MCTLMTFVDVAILLALQFQNAKAGGNLQIALLSYAFSYQTEDGTATPPPVDKNVIVVEEYANFYKPQWNISGVLKFDGRSEKANSQTTANISVEDWPWSGPAECSTNTQYRFLICLDYVNSFDPQRPCALQRLQTELVPTDRAVQNLTENGVEIITFTNYLILSEDNKSVISNPFRIRFPDWKGAVRLAVYIDCCSENSKHKGRCKEMLSTVIDLTPRIFLEGRLTIRRVLSGRGSLIVSIGASCDIDYFKPSCDVHCRVDNMFTDHRFCNTSSGIKQCLPGWSGSDCQVDVNECEDPICQNGATCVNRPGAFFCSCPMGTQGRFCGQRTPMCHIQPCQNSGTCLDTPTNTECFCTPGFTGPLCQFLLQENHELTTQLETTQKSTTVSRFSSTLDTVEAKRSKVLDHKEEAGWQHWYLAVILGGVLLLALVLIVVVLQRFNITNGYKVTLSLSSSRQARVSTSSQQEISDISREVYQIDNHNIMQSAVLNTLHNNNAVDTDENLIFDKAAIDPKTKTDTGMATSLSTSCINDYLYLCSDAVSSSSVDNVRVNSMTTLEVNTKKNKQHKYNKRADHMGHHSTDLTDLPAFTKQNQGHHEGPYAVSSCFNEQNRLSKSKRGRSKSTFLAEEIKDTDPIVRNRQGCFPRSHSGVEVKSTWEIKNTTTTSFCNLHTSLDTRSDENEYEEIDTSHISQPYQSKLAHKYFPSVGRKSLRHSRLWLRTAMPGIETREDDGGYLVPSVLTTLSPNKHAADVGSVSNPGIYDYPRIIDENTVSTHKAASLFNVSPENNKLEKSFNNHSAISLIPLSPNISLSAFQDDDTFQIYSTPKDYNVYENSTEQLYANSIYVNSNVYYNNMDNPYTSPPE